MPRWLGINRDVQKFVDPGGIRRSDLFRRGAGCAIRTGPLLKPGGMIWQEGIYRYPGDRICQVRRKECQRHAEDSHL